MQAKLTKAMTICFSLLLAACRDPYDPSVTEPGPNGEPGPALTHVHSKEFRVAEAEYFAALNEFYSFALSQGFYKIEFGDCFADILDIVPNEKAEPCIGMYAVNGSPVKAHMTFNIVAKSFNRLDRNDFLTCRVDIYASNVYNPVRTIAPAFQAKVDRKLEELDRKVAAGFERKQ